MAIRLVHGVPPELQAELALQAGQGQYAQRQQELALQQERFDREEQLRRDLAALQDMQQRRSLGANMYQFDATRADRAIGNQQNIEAELQREAMRQQGFADMRESDAAMQSERLASQENQFRTREQNRIQEHYLDQEFNAGMASAKILLSELPDLNPAQQQQALQQWSDRFGQTVGEFPFFNQQQGPEQQELADVEAKMRNIHGDAFSPNQARDYLELSPQERSKYDLDAAKLKADKEKIAQDAEIRRWVKQQEAVDKSAMDWQNHEQSLTIKVEEAKQKEIEAQRRQLFDAIAAATKPVSSGLPGEAPKVPSLEQAREQINLAKQLWEEFGVGAGAGSQSQQDDAFPTYDDTQAESASIGEVFYYNGEKVVKRSATVLERVID